jgi:hypothetical protein
MTSHSSNPSGRPVTPRAAGHPTTVVRDHTVVGTAVQLANVVANHRTAGTLIAMTTPRPVTANLLQTVLSLREPAPVRPTVRTATRHHGQNTHPQHSWAAVIAVLGTIAGLLTAAAYLIGQLVEFLAGHAWPILVVLALAAIPVAAITATRRHCPGC